jgi:histone H3/H4
MRHHALHAPSPLMWLQELPTVAKEATFLISLATEEFIKRLSEASHHIAHREKRVTVQQRDIGAMVCCSTHEYLAHHISTEHSFRSS